MLEIRCAVRRGDFALDVDLQLPSPGVSALFGVSGAGKSTLVGALAGLLRPEHGRIALDGEVLFDAQVGIDLRAQRRGVGCVFQDGRLFPHYDVAGNLRYGLRRARGRAVRIRFEHVVELLGLGSLLHRRPLQLSGGEQQRVALGRALLSQPRLLLLDEPLASLDRARKEELLPYFERLRDELAVPIVHVTHAFDEVIRLAQQVVVLDRGRVTIAAPLAEVCRSSALHVITGSAVTGAVLEGIVAQDPRGADLVAAHNPRGADPVVAHSPRGSTDPAAAGRDVERLVLVRCGDLELRIAGGGLEPGARVRLYVAADDVAVARERPRAISTRNVIAARIERLESGDSVALLHLTAGGERLLARVTHSAVRELQLVPGAECFALFKAVATHGRRFDRALAPA